MRIVAAHHIHKAVRERLEPYGTVDVNPTFEPYSSQQLIEKCRDAHALMAFMTERVDASFLDACPKLQVIGGALKGYNNFDIDACTRRNVLVTNVPDLLTEPTAELALGMMISVARNLVPSDRALRSDGFAGWRPTFYGGSVIGATVGIIGAGAVGRALFRMLSGFPGKRLYVDKTAMTAVEEAGLRCQKVELPDLLLDSDFVVLGLHLTPETHHYVDAAFIDTMKPGSYLINPARGSLVDEAEVARALSDGRLGGYASDTFELEDWQLSDRPSTIDERILQSDKSILTPHIGSAVKSVREEIEMSAADSIVSALSGELPDTAVNSHAFVANSDKAYAR